jgi:CRISPR-associated protein Csb3
LDLADRRWPEAEVCGYFESTRFLIRADDGSCSIRALLEEFAAVECRALDPLDKATSPIYLMAPFDLRLDWWWKPKKSASGTGALELSGGSTLKTWAGQQSGPLIFRLMKRASAKAGLKDSPLDYSDEIRDDTGGRSRGKSVSPFYFDSRREGTSLDIGFSADEQAMSVREYPAVEALAFVGLQRFRPVEDSQTGSFFYTAWAEPLPAVPAAVAACGLLHVRSRGTFGFTKPSRGGEYARMFSRATRERSKDV